MVRLRKLNQSAKLPFKTKLCLGTPSRHQMENRAEFTPPASENKKLKVLLETLGRIQSESRQLQSDDVMLWEIQGELSWLAPITSLLVSGFNLRKQHLLNRQGKKAVQPFLRQPESEVSPEG
ncbi:hypothetical protein PPTG_06114 [Phytophthora nicotianae INRA-310]|uniref:Uncharacterized protein n=1 Tax=Phytophthora nicotianae (strain INRA-310) TaxID=761204 RepID=W2QV38_PHYN3|nr:hypothetical protein PPTG_06114 [Phytophthora nicotianae INRA-310]ETN17087.1 hypothetical protein PPTG_06114 [Phytophthora nicotianae INRA-310]